jgi:hypothetical protein
MADIKGVNSLYLQAVQLLVTAVEEDKESVNVQMNTWTFDNLLDEVKLFNPRAWVAYPETSENYVGELLGIKVLINEQLKDTDIILVSQNKKPAIDNPIIIVLK